MVATSGAWRVVFTRQAQEDARRIARSGLRGEAEELLEVLRRNPRQSALSSEKLVGDLQGALSGRINFQHRLVYQVLDADRTVKVVRMWTHSEAIEDRPRRRGARSRSLAAPRTTDEEPTGVGKTAEERTGEQERNDREGGWRVW